MSNSSATPRIVAHQAPLSMGFSRQEYQSGLPFPSPGDLPRLGIDSKSSALAGEFFLPLSHQGSPVLFLTLKKIAVSLLLALFWIYSFFHFLYLSWSLMVLFVFVCGYLINLNLHAYQSLKLITILILLNKRGTLNFSHSFLLSIYMILCILITYIIPQNIIDIVAIVIFFVILYSQCLPIC